MCVCERVAGRGGGVEYICSQNKKREFLCLLFFHFSIFSDVSQYVFDPKAGSSSKATKGGYFDQPSREKEVTTKGQRALTVPISQPNLNSMAAYHSDSCV